MTDERTTVSEDEALDALRRANPASVARPETARAARVFATVTSRHPRRTGWLQRPAVAVAGGLAVVAIAAVGVFAATTGGDSNPDGGAVPADDDSGSVSVDVGGGMAMSCAFGYAVETLKEREYAFDGTLIEVAPAPTQAGGEEPFPVDGPVTFQVHEWFNGGGGETVTLAGSALSIGYGSEDESATLTIGDRYLVSGDDEYVWSCGFTKTYSGSTASEWRDAFAN
jgi:hypothetical protein